MSFAINAALWGLRKLINAQEEARKKLDENYRDTMSKISQIENENKSLKSLMSKYEQFKDLTSYTSEQKEDLIQIQKDYIETLGHEVEGLDLVNKKYEENIELIKQERIEKAKRDAPTYREAVKSATERTKDNDERTIFSDIMNDDYQDLVNLLSEIEGITISKTDIIKSRTRIGGTERKKVGEDLRIFLDSDDSDKMAQAALSAYNAIEEYNKKNRTNKYEDVATAIYSLYDQYNTENDELNKAYAAEARNILERSNFKIDNTFYDVNNLIPSIYKEWYDKVVEEFANNDDRLEQAIIDQLNTLYSDKKYSEMLKADEYLKEYGESWPLFVFTEDSQKELEENFATFNSQFDEQIDQVQEKAKELQSALSSIDSNSFDADTMTDFFQKFPDLAQYANDTTKLRSEIIKLMAENPKELIENLTKFKNALPDEADQAKVQGVIDNINALGMLSIDDEVKRVIDDFGNLKSATEKLESGEYEASDLQALFESFPELRKYSSDISKLTDKTRELAETEASDLLLALNTLRETTTDPEVLAGINAWISSISRLSFTTNSLLEYETSKIDDIIEGIEDQNEKLQEQLDIINEMIEGYETAASMVQTYVDEQVQALEDEKQAIEDDYNAQIKAIQDKNKEREQEINLQEKLDALLNARKKKVNVYSETNGWKLQRNSTAIEEAKREYEQARDEKQIADLEKQRDAATEGFEERIKAWNDYGDEWSKAIDKVKNAAAYEKADEILGEDWREAANRKDKTLLNNVITNYNDYLNKRKPKVEAEIKENDKLIKNYESLKDEMNKMLDTTKTKTNEYLDSLMKIAPSELDSYEKRQQYLKNFCAAMDQILDDSSYGSWLIGKKDSIVDDATLNAAQQVTFQNGKLLYDAISGQNNLLNKSPALAFGKLGELWMELFDNKSKKYTSTTSNVFNFSGDIKTNNPVDFMNRLNSLIKQGRLDSMVGK